MVTPFSVLLTVLLSIHIPIQVEFPLPRQEKLTDVGRIKKGKRKTKRMLFCTRNFLILMHIPKKN